MKLNVESIHEKIKPYECSFCEYKFSHNKNLKTNIKTIHRIIKSYKCSICNTHFKHKYKSRLHIKYVHDGKKSHRFSTCDYSCSTLAALRDVISKTGKIAA